MNSYEQKMLRRMNKFSNTKLHNYQISFLKNDVSVIVTEKNNNTLFKIDDNNPYTLSQLLKNLENINNEKKDRILKSLVEANELNKKLILKSKFTQKYNG